MWVFILYPLAATTVKEVEEEEEESMTRFLFWNGTGKSLEGAILWHEVSFKVLLKCLVKCERENDPRVK